jgi:hypothetical protein
MRCSIYAHDNGKNVRTNGNFDISIPAGTEKFKYVRGQ